MVAAIALLWSMVTKCCCFSLPWLACPDSLACSTWLAVDKHDIEDLDHDLNSRAIYWISQTFLATSTDNLIDCLLENAVTASPAKAFIYWVAHVVNITYEELLDTRATSRLKGWGYRHARRVDDVTDALLLRACKHALHQGNDYIGRKPFEKEHRGMALRVIERCIDSRPLQDHETPCLLFLYKAIKVVNLVHRRWEESGTVSLLRRHILATGTTGALAAIHGTWRNIVFQY